MASEEALVQGDVQDMGDGTYAADYTATKAGEYLAKVTYNGLPVLTCQGVARAAHHDGASAALASSIFSSVSPTLSPPSIKSSKITMIST